MGRWLSDVAQALALEQAGIPVSVPPGAAISVQDCEAAIDGLTAAQIADLPALGITAIEVSNLAGLTPLTIEAA